MPEPAILDHHAHQAWHSSGRFLQVEEPEARPHSLMQGHGHAGAHVCVVVAGSFDETGPRRSIQRCEPGMMRISAPGRRHQIRFGPDGARCLLFVMSPRWPRAAPLFPIPRAPDLFLRDKGLGALAASIRGHARDTGADAALKAETLVAELLARAHQPESPPEWLGQARNLLLQRYREGVNLAELAEEVGVHRVHLARAFARHFGIPARSYLNTQRLAAAARKLADSRLPIAEVALEAGFFDQSHLCRAFRNRFGVSPAVFRQRAAQRQALGQN